MVSFWNANFSSFCSTDLFSLNELGAFFGLRLEYSHYWQIKSLLAKELFRTLVSIYNCWIWRACYKSSLNWFCKFFFLFWYSRNKMKTILHFKKRSAQIWNIIHIQGYELFFCDDTGEKMRVWGNLQSFKLLLFRPSFKKIKHPVIMETRMLAWSRNDSPFDIWTHIWPLGVEQGL